MKWNKTKKKLPKYSDYYLVNTEFERVSIAIYNKSDKKFYDLVRKEICYPIYWAKIPLAPCDKNMVGVYKFHTNK